MILASRTVDFGQGQVTPLQVLQAMRNRYCFAVPSPIDPGGSKTFYIT